MAYPSTTLRVLGLGICIIFCIQQWQVQAQQHSSVMGPYSNANGTPSGTKQPKNSKLNGGYKELPQPGTQAAQALLGDPSTSGSVREVYTYYQDSSAITADCTAAFLQQLKQQLQANPSLAGSPSSSSKVAKDTQSFTKVSADVLNYLRYMKSSVLLDLLRKFCMAGGTQLDLSAVDPKQLQAELTRVLNPAALNSYFKAQSNRDGSRNDSASRNGMPRKVSEYGGYERPGGK